MQIHSLIKTKKAKKITHSRFGTGNLGIEYWNLYMGLSDFAENERNLEQNSIEKKKKKKKRKTHFSFTTFFFFTTIVKQILI